MHAYNRTEVDQTDSVGVCATKEEWSEIVDLLFNEAGDHLQPHTAAWQLIANVTKVIR